MLSYADVTSTSKTMGLHCSSEISDVDNHLYFKIFTTYFVMYDIILFEHVLSGTELVSNNSHVLVTI